RNQSAELKSAPGRISSVQTSGRTSPTRVATRTMRSPFAKSGGSALEVGAALQANLWHRRGGNRSPVFAGGGGLTWGIVHPPSSAGRGGWWRTVRWRTLRARQSKDYGRPRSSASQIDEGTARAQWS